MEDIPGAFLLSNLPKSTPHTPSPSASSSIQDITAQAAIMQETLETSMIFSDSTVSLVSLDINDGSNVHLPGHTFNDITNQNIKNKSILRHRNLGPDDASLRRRVSLQ
jgi:hypothetical protein